MIRERFEVDDPPEVVFVTSNPLGTRQICAGCHEIGIPCYGECTSFSIAGSPIHVLHGVSRREKVSSPTVHAMIHMPPAALLAQRHCAFDVNVMSEPSNLMAMARTIQARASTQPPSLLCTRWREEIMLTLRPLNVSSTPCHVVLGLKSCPTTLAARQDCGGIEDWK